MSSSTALAHPNIAFVKYWGNRDHELRIPANGSISMNLAGLETRTQVTFNADLPDDALILNGEPDRGPALARTRAVLDRVRALAGVNQRASVVSDNNFPIGAGIASSASAFAALALAASNAAGLKLDTRGLSRLARRGSGSACRSVPGGFAEWHPGSSDEDCYATSLAPANYWGLVDCIAVISTQHKPTGSTEGHLLAETSPLQHARVADTPCRLERCRRAILDRDFESLSDVIELDSNLMHAVMMTSTPPLIYWLPASIEIMRAVQSWRADGIPVCYTLDAGPNVHLLTIDDYAKEVEGLVLGIDDVQDVLQARPGGPAVLV